jgi:ERCC4-related helicase
MIVGFGVEKVTINGFAHSKSERWREIQKRPYCSAIDVRGVNDYDPSYCANEPTIEDDIERIPIKFPRLVNASVLHSPDYQFQDLIEKKIKIIPRDYQLEAYHHCLGHNMIVIFPTGYGKTLVAAMAMHRFKLLNRAKLVVMIVDRIPLVEQQSREIQKITGMFMCPLHGQNNTPYTRRRLSEGKYDGLVITGGLLCELLARKSALKITHFSVMVFDECHHVTGNHSYVNILEIIDKCVGPFRPRVIGLTASPINLKQLTVDQASKQLTTLQRQCMNARIYRPNLNEESIRLIERHVVKLSPQQLEHQSILNKDLRMMMKEFCDCLSDIDRNQVQVPKHCEFNEKCGAREWNIAMNIVSSLPPNASPELMKLSREIRSQIYKLMDNYLLGPIFLSEIEPCHSYDDTNIENGYSSLLCELKNVLTACQESQGILVFVEMRTSAEKIRSFIQRLFPSFNSEKLVGQGGIDGMNWKGPKGQNAIIESFSRKETQLIVCTSVLEEGSARGVIFCNHVEQL